MAAADGGSSEHFELICCKCVDTYVTVKRNQNQICWKFKKVGLCGVRLLLMGPWHDSFTDCVLR